MTVKLDTRLDRLRALRAQIEEHGPEGYDQSYWFMWRDEHGGSMWNPIDVGDGLPFEHGQPVFEEGFDPTTDWTCGTTACLAGHGLTVIIRGIKDKAISADDLCLDDEDVADTHIVAEFFDIDEDAFMAYWSSRETDTLEQLDGWQSEYLDRLRAERNTDVLDPEDYREAKRQAVLNYLTDEIAQEIALIDGTGAEERRQLGIDT